MIQPSFYSREQIIETAFKLVREKNGAIYLMNAGKAFYVWGLCKGGDVNDSDGN